MYGTCHKLVRNSADLPCRFSANFWGAACRLPYTICCRLYAETLPGIRRTFIRTCGMFCWKIAVEGLKGIAQQFRRLDNLRSLKDCSEDSYKTNPWVPERQFCGSPRDNSAGSPQMIHKLPHRLSRKSTTDYRGRRRISVSSLWHVPYMHMHTHIHIPTLTQSRQPFATPNCSEQNIVFC